MKLRVILAAALGVAAFLLVPGSPAQARACKINYTCYTDYYSDSTHTTLVGGTSTDCDGTVETWGTRSAYQVFDESPC